MLWRQCGGGWSDRVHVTVSAGHRVGELLLARTNGPVGPWNMLTSRGKAPGKTTYENPLLSSEPNRDLAFSLPALKCIRDSFPGFVDHKRGSAWRGWRFWPDRALSMMLC